VPSPPSAPAGRLTEARAVLHRHFGFDRFRPPQFRVIRSVLSGADVLAVLPTGAGKSVCFQVPALMGSGLTLVISPLISLMQDQVQAARRRGIPAGYVNSTLSADEQQEAVREAAAGPGRLLYVAPERLDRLVHDLKEAGAAVSALAVDEAHCISEWGHDFRPAYRRILEARRAFGWPQTVALTGSAMPGVRFDIVEALGLGQGRDGLPGRLDRHLESFDRPNLRFEVQCVRNPADRLKQLLRLLGRTPDATIVYAATRNITEAIARVLGRFGLRARAYHAGLTKEQRAEVLARFLEGEVTAVVATCAFGMGIDKPDVRLVAHWTLPATPESYYQEAGRAGRDGRPARCVALFHPGDATLHRLQVETTFPPERLVMRAWQSAAALARLPSGVQVSVARLKSELRPDQGMVDWTAVRSRRNMALRRIAAVRSYARSRGCRRRVLIGWFGERLGHCASCDRCDRRS